MIYYFHPIAEQEYYRSIQFYESKSKGLGLDFIQDFEFAIEQISAFPLRYKIECQPNIRKISLLRFPYHVIYRMQNNHIQLLAVFHKRRLPNDWHERL